MTTSVALAAQWVQAVIAQDWAAVWQLHDPQALMIIGPQVLPRDLIPEAAYVKVQESIAAVLRPLIQPRFAWIDGEAIEGPHGPIVLGRLREDMSERVVTVGIQVAPTGGVVAVVVDPTRPELVETEAIADLAQLPVATDRHEAFLTTLHHSYTRRRLGMRQAIRVLPEARFTCQGRGDCCQVGKWSISVSDNQRQALARFADTAGITPFTLAEPSGPPVYADPLAMADRHRLATGVGSACHELTPEGGCQVHAVLGWQPIPVCALYPISPVPTPDGFDVTVHFSCETVCHNAGTLLSEQLPALRGRLWPFQFRLEGVPDELLLVRGGDAIVSWSTYKAWEAELLDLLAEFPRHGVQALIEGGRRLARWLAPHQAQTMADADGLFEGLLKPGIPSEWQSGWMGGGYLRAWDLVKQHPVRCQPDGELIGRYLRTVFFRKYGLVGREGGASFPWGLAILAYRMILADSQFRALREQRQETSERDVVAAVRAVEALIGHEPLPGWLAQRPGSPMECPGTWSALLKGLA